MSPARPGSKKDGAARKKKKVTVTGLLGVTFDIRRNKWKARFNYNKKERFLGRFDSPKEAASAYDQAIDIVQRLQLRAGGTCRKRGKNFPDQAFDDPQVELRVMELLQDDKGYGGEEEQQQQQQQDAQSSCEESAEEEEDEDGAFTGGETSSASSSSGDMQQEPAAAVGAAIAATPVLLKHDLLPTGGQAAVAGAVRATSSDNASSNSHQQQQRAINNSASVSQQHCSCARAGPSFVPAVCTPTYSPMQHLPACSSAVTPAAAVQESSCMAGMNGAAAAAAPRAEQQLFSGVKHSPGSFAPVATMLLEPGCSSTADLGPAAAAAAVAPEPSAAAADNAPRVWQRHASPQLGEAAAAMRSSSTAAFQQLQTPFASASMSDIFSSQPAQHKQQQQCKQQTFSVKAEASPPDKESEDMDAFLQALLDSAHQEDQHLQHHENLFRGPGQLRFEPASTAAVHAELQLQPPYLNQHVWQQQPAAEQPSCVQATGRPALHHGCHAKGPATHSNQPPAQQQAAAAGSSLLHEVLRQQQLLRQVMGRQPQPSGMRPAATPAAAGARALQARHSVEAMCFAPASHTSAPAALTAADVVPRLDNTPSSSSWLAGQLNCPAKALSFAAVCIQAVVELRAQLRLLAPGQASSNQWLCNLRHELQGQVAVGTVAADVSVAAILMMQHLASMLSGAGAFAGGGGSSNITDLQASRSFGVAVCDSLKAALWLLHRQLVSAHRHGGTAAAAVLQQWVSDLRAHVSCRADAAVLQLVAFM